MAEATTYPPVDRNAEAAPADAISDRVNPVGPTGSMTIRSPSTKRTSPFRRLSAASAYALTDDADAGHDSPA
jgi:hypothetical protein